MESAQDRDWEDATEPMNLAWVGASLCNERCVRSSL
jgi:hypothetical protein